MPPSFTLVIQALLLASAFVRFVNRYFPNPESLVASKTAKFVA